MRTKKSPYATAADTFSIDALLSEVHGRESQSRHDRIAANDVGPAIASTIRGSLMRRAA